MDVDLDHYRDPANTPETLRLRREALLDQLGWLADEAEALGPLLDRLPAWVLEQAPLPGERSVKETLAVLTALDRSVYSRWIGRLVAEDDPALDPPDAEGGEGANARDMVELLDDLRTARAALTEWMRKVPEADWSRTALLGGERLTLYELVLRIVRRDADDLRTLAYRLHEAWPADQGRDEPR